MTSVTVNFAMLRPALALICWHHVIWAWMYATRIPAIRKARVDFNNAKNKVCGGWSIDSVFLFLTNNYSYWRRLRDFVGSFRQM